MIKIELFSLVEVIISVFVLSVSLSGRGGKFENFDFLFFVCLLKYGEGQYHVTLVKQTIEKSIYKDCGEGKVLIRLKIQS